MKRVHYLGIFVPLILVLSCKKIKEPVPEPAPAINNYYGGSDGEVANAILPAPNGGVIVAGTTRSIDGDVTGQHGNAKDPTDDAWVIKLNNQGGIEWQKALGSTGNDGGNAIVATADGGYVLAGSANTNDGDVTGLHGGDDAWLVKIDNAGNKVWQKTYGGSGEDRASAIVASGDGGFVFAGWTNSTDGDVTGLHGREDFWIVKVDQNGNKVWQKTLGGSSSDYGYALTRCSDGGYVAVGQTYSDDGDVSGRHGNSDIWMVKVDANGTKLWQQTFGGSDQEMGRAVVQTSDGGYALTGFTKSTNGNVTLNHGDLDAWVIRTNAVGTILWQKTFGGTGFEFPYALVQTNTGGFLLVAETSSNDANVPGNHGRLDAFVVKMDENGNQLSQQVLGTAGDDAPLAVAVSPANNYTIAGYSNSKAGVYTPGKFALLDFWVLTLPAQ